MSDVSNKWPLAKLQALTSEQRYSLWLNARRLGGVDGEAVVSAVETSGLEYAERGGMSMSDPRVLEMRDIIESGEGRSACLQATAANEAALAGVEPLIVARMGSRYGPFSQMTVTAGSLVGEQMLSLGYKIDGRRKMPEGAIAQTAAFWVKR